MIKIERVNIKDAEELLSIYAPYVSDTAVSFEYEVPSLAEFQERIRRISAQLPYIKAVEDNEILGYAYAARFKERKAYDWSVEVTVYVRKDVRRAGVGSRLYGALEDSLRSIGVLNMNACIAVPKEEDEHLGNDSYYFHKKMGYRLVGTFHNSGYKFDTWYDMVWMEKMIGEHKNCQERVKYGEWTIDSQETNTDNLLCVPASCHRILETERLYLRELNYADLESLRKILQDEETMYAYEGAFSDAEVKEWLDRQILRYQKWHFGLWAVIRKETDEMIGQCGLTMQPWKDTEVLEIGYLFQKKYWHHGYATEAAKACKQYAFDVLDAEEVCSIIRDTNMASRNVAVRNGMVPRDSWTKHYRGVDMPHDRYVVIR